MNDSPITNTAAAAEVFNLDPDDHVEVMHQVYGSPAEKDGTSPLFREASPTQTQA